eukprot:GHVQ01001374.1.p1 GENE.GHVQ01001374.1~~GHVQ01001374.1.p1  ORF type:complete len:101 (+),score=4.42 GHVQ01001374.1:175-477(+)
MMSALFNGAEAHVCRVGRLRPETSIFFCCDIQELFRPLILKMPHVIDTARRMGDAAKILGSILLLCRQILLYYHEYLWWSQSSTRRRWDTRYQRSTLLAL